MMTFRQCELVYDRIYEAQPLKGVCLFGGNFEEQDYSMVYCGAFFHNLYRLEKRDGEYVGVLQKDFIENLLNRVAQTGRTVVFRPVACEGGIKMDENLFALLEADGDVYYNDKRSYPNWDNPTLLSCFLDFIKQFGQAYDGDPRIACVQFGLYGEYGEWNFCGVKQEHRSLVKMSCESQQKLVAQYCRYFKKTKLQARNPNMGNSRDYPIGFHDDNFVFNSAEYHTPGWDAMMNACALNDGEPDGAWYELHQFEDFIRDNQLEDRWKEQMMGAEISGVMAFKNKEGEYFFGNMFEGESLSALIYCTTHFHMTFSLGFQRGGGGVPQKGTPQYENFRYAASVFGYDFTLCDASLEKGLLTCSLENAGVAPLYYDWDVELSLVKDETEIYAKRMKSELHNLLPMQRQDFHFDLSQAQIATGVYEVRFRIINPLQGEAQRNRFPLILSNKNRNGEYAIAGTLTVE